MLSEQQKNEIKAALLKKAPNLTCPMCKSQHFGLAQGYLSLTLQPAYNSVTLGGQVIPTIGVICENCGFISQHAIGVLGLLPKSVKPIADESK